MLYITLIRLYNYISLSKQKRKKINLKTSTQFLFHMKKKLNSIKLRS